MTKYVSYLLGIKDGKIINFEDVSSITNVLLMAHILVLSVWFVIQIEGSLQKLFYHVNLGYSYTA